MSDHERGPEDDEEETKPAAKRPKFDQTESRVWPGHVYVSKFGGKEDDVPKVPPELDIFEDLDELNPGYVYKHIEKLDTDKRAYGWPQSSHVCVCVFTFMDTEVVCGYIRVRICA